jgi:hypothetical protein
MHLAIQLSMNLPETRALRNFHSALCQFSALQIADPIANGEIAFTSKQLLKGIEHAALLLSHSPVDGLHTIENRPVKHRVFSLTEILKGVKTYSFFGSF